MRRIGLISVLGLGGCTADNPFLNEEGTGSTSGGLTSAATVDMRPSSITDTTDAVTSNGSSAGDGTADGSLQTGADGMEASSVGETSTTTATTEEGGTLVVSSTGSTTEVGSDEAAYTGTGSDGGESSTGGGSIPCPEATHHCVEPAPHGWFGPVAGWSSQDGVGEEPLCPAEFPTKSFTRYQNLVDMGGTCSCRCEVDNPSCRSNFMLGYSRAPRPEDDGVCFLNGGDIATIPLGTTCGPVELPHEDDLPTRFHFTVPQPAPLTGGTCRSVASSQLEDPFFQDTLMGCGPDEYVTSTCEDDTSLCLPKTPETFNEGLCIFRQPILDETEPEPECPAMYPHRYDTHGVFEDNRYCGPCTCGEREGECLGTVDLFYSTNCNEDTFVGTIQAWAWDESPRCTDFPDDPHVRSARWEASTVEASCPATGGDILGSIDLFDELIVCCSGPQSPAEEAEGSTG